MVTLDITSKKPNRWIDVLALLLLLLGIYMGIRTTINLVAFDKYPSTGILTFSFSGPPYSPREQDCYYPVYGPGEGNSKKLEELKKEEALNRKFCLEGVKEARESTKVNDISQSLLFLFLGIGLFTARRTNFI